MFKLVIFDLDGTLLNTIGDIAESCNYALKMCGYDTHPINKYNHFVGNGIMKLFERALPANVQDGKTLREIKEYFMWHYSKNCNVYTKPYDGVIELLKKLQKRNCSLAVASNKYQEATEKIIAQYFKEINFIKVLGQREGIPIKPDPYILHEIMACAGVKPNETLYIGDSGVDATTACNVVGLTFIGVCWGFRDKDELKSCGASIFANKADDIYNFFINAD